MLERTRSSQSHLVLQASTWIAANPAALRVAIAVLAFAVAAGSMLLSGQPVFADPCDVSGSGC
jgi:hypothetical protein